MFLVSAILIVGVGVRLVRQAEVIAARTGLGQALVGMLLLGAVTSLPGLVASATAAGLGNAELAFANAFGGIAAQTLSLAIADMVYPRANLEHAAASVANLIQAALLTIMHRADVPPAGRLSTFPRTS